MSRAWVYQGWDVFWTLEERRAPWEGRLTRSLANEYPQAPAGKRLRLTPLLSTSSSTILGTILFKARFPLTYLVTLAAADLKTKCAPLANAT